MGQFSCGWVIAVSSFFTHFASYSAAFASGVWNNIFLQEFNESFALTAWTGAGLNCASMVSAFASSFLIPRFGCRNLIVSGGIVMAVGQVLTGLAQKVSVLLVTFSAIQGAGAGLCMLTSVEIVFSHFKSDARLGLATGIAVSGNGIGVLLVPVLEE